LKVVAYFYDTYTMINGVFGVYTGLAVFRRQIVIVC
jgi:hypothetical protein